jgi:CMP-N,N'-diacetyllegionaminic acid synthase
VDVKQLDVLAIIPARGGSKGLPGKNLAQIGGVPLIVWSIRAALDSALVTRVVVTTDSEEIAAVASSEGAEVPWLRPAELAKDETPDLPVFVHALAELFPETQDPELVVHLRPTVPLRPSGIIDRAIQMLRKRPDADSLRSLSLSEKSPFKMWTPAEDGLLEPVIGSWEEEWFNQPRQALPDVWVHNGMIDVIRTGVIRGGSMSGNRILPMFEDSIPVVDIDTAADLDRAAEILNLHQSKLLGDG